MKIEMMSNNLIKKIAVERSESQTTNMQFVSNNNERDSLAVIKAYYQSNGIRCEIEKTPDGYPILIMHFQDKYLWDVYIKPFKNSDKFQIYAMFCLVNENKINLGSEMVKTLNGEHPAFRFWLEKTPNGTAIISEFFSPILSPNNTIESLGVKINEFVKILDDEFYKQKPSGLF